MDVPLPSLTPSMDIALLTGSKHATSIFQSKILPYFLKIHLERSYDVIYPWLLTYLSSPSPLMVPCLGALQSTVTEWRTIIYILRARSLPVTGVPTYNQ